MIHNISNSVRDQGSDPVAIFDVTWWSLSKLRWPTHKKKISPWSDHKIIINIIKDHNKVTAISETKGMEN